MGIQSLSTTYLDSAKGKQYKIEFTLTDHYVWRAEVWERGDFKFPPQMRQWRYQGFIRGADDPDLDNVLVKAHEHMVAEYGIGKKEEIDG